MLKTYSVECVRPIIGSLMQIDPVADDLDVVLERMAKCHGKITQAQAAKFLGWSINYFHRGFKKKAGVSFRAKRFQIKMEIARSFLTSTSMTIEQIATKLDYSERGNFERAFKHAYGVTPTQFRILHALQTTASRYHRKPTIQNID